MKRFDWSKVRHELSLFRFGAGQRTGLSFYDAKFVNIPYCQGELYFIVLELPNHDFVITTEVKFMLLIDL